MVKQKLSDIKTETPVTIIAHKDDIEVVNDRDDVMDITPESTLAMAAKFNPITWQMAKLDDDFMSRLRILFPDIDFKDDERPLSDFPVGLRHAVGLIICTNMAINTGKQPFWRFPETYLHPSTQSKLAELMNRYVKEGQEAASKSE